ncbi:cupredoxin domain-containing protein [Nocardia sp. NBC_01327]|uniref:cupredoxin domain-containing protein n=1 Tax=Nocardia sp. NBC_01327 TaxID=2903593 RepID=UPI002E125B27|nr:cupredoxin domain-containing protein [Nocardia sp. NBC_01327]
MPASVLAVLLIGASPAHADPLPIVQLGFHNGYCSTTEVGVPANTPFDIDIDTTFQFTDTSQFRIPALGIRVILPSAYFNPHTRVEIGPQPPGPIPFELETPWVSGSAGKGCFGTIQVW